jgi:hypothetical protein
MGPGTGAPGPGVDGAKSGEIPALSRNGGPFTRASPVAWPVPSEFWPSEEGRVARVRDDRAAAGRRRDRAPLPVVLAACGVLLLITMTAGVGIGSVALSPAAVWQVIAGHLSGHAENTVAGTIVWQIRLPRVLHPAAFGLPPDGS